MESVLRPAVIYIFLLVIFRIAGRRTLAQLTNFDFILLLIIGESTQQALLGEDYSVTNAMVVIVTLVAIDIGISLLKERSATLERWIEGVPLVLVDEGGPHAELLCKARVSEEDILESAREQHGLYRFDQIRYAILERSGHISIIPK